MTLTLEICRASGDVVSELGAEWQTVTVENSFGNTSKETRQFCTVDSLEELLEEFDSVIIDNPNPVYVDIDVDYVVTVKDHYIE